MKTIRDYDIKNKKVIIRCDFNVPIKKGRITDITRIKESIETIKYAIDKGSKVILLSHLGKVKTKEDKEDKSLEIIVPTLSKLLKQDVIFSKYTSGDKLKNMVNKLKDGEVLLVENTRFEDIDGKKESGCDTDLSNYWASLGDIFINDAYGTLHRAHASNVGIGSLLPNGIGFLAQREISKIDEVLKSNTHPFIIVMGGLKINDKIKTVGNLIKKCDIILIGGAMAYTFLEAQGYNVGQSIVDDESKQFCRRMLKKYKKKIILPKDAVTNEGIKKIKKFDSDDIGYDIGPKTIKLFKKKLKYSKRVILNGPMGMFEEEEYSHGTKEIYSYLIDNNIKTLVGGGDTASSVNNLGFKDKFYHVSTGGGATLEYLGGIKLPGLEVINK